MIKTVVERDRRYIRGDEYPVADHEGEQLIRLGAALRITDRDENETGMGGDVKALGAAPENKGMKRA